MKFALSAFAERYSLPGRPTGGSPSAIDAHKQTQFLLGDDLSLFERAMNAQLAVVAHNRRARSPAASALLFLWSRVFSHLSDACALVCLGSYVSCPPLLRAALDCIAVERSLIAGGFSEYEEWFEAAVSQGKEQQALSIELGRYRAGSVLAENERLGALYRLLTDLSMPHFGSTALQVAPDSNLQKLSMTFADSAFHLGWAELTVGWLLQLSDGQLEALLEQETLSVTDEWRREISRTRRDIAAVVSSTRRCRVEEVDGRFVFHDFRRRAFGQPRRVML